MSVLVSSAKSGVGMTILQAGKTRINEKPCTDFAGVVLDLMAEFKPP